MTTMMWFLVALSMNGDGTWVMQEKPVVKDSHAHCVEQDYYQSPTIKVVCVEADDFADLIQILLDNFDFGGKPA